MKILVLDTGLFPGQGVLEDAFEQLGPEHEISRYDANAELTDHDWDHVVQVLVSGLQLHEPWQETMSALPLSRRQTSVCAWRCRPR